MSSLEPIALGPHALLVMPYVFYLGRDLAAPFIKISTIYLILEAEAFDEIQSTACTFCRSEQITRGEVMRETWGLDDGICCLHLNNASITQPTHPAVSLSLYS